MNRRTLLLAATAALAQPTSALASTADPEETIRVNGSFTLLGFSGVSCADFGFMSVSTCGAMVFTELAREGRAQHD